MMSDRDSIREALDRMEPIVRQELAERRLADRREPARGGGRRATDSPEHLLTIARAVLWLAEHDIHVHENTVRIRIRHAEEVLALGLSERRAEVLAALRLRQLLGPRP